MKTIIQKCIICGREVETTRERFGKASSEGRTSAYLTSNEGVLFHYRWFCNECWGLLTKHLKTLTQPKQTPLTPISHKPKGIKALHSSTKKRRNDG